MLVEQLANITLKASGPEVAMAAVSYSVFAAG